MLNRILPIVGGLLAAGALAAGPAAASVSAPAAAPLADDCDDRYAPSSRWGRNWSGHDGDGYYWRGWGDGDGYFGGHSYDDSCDVADHKGTVSRVMVALKRQRGPRCQHLLPSGRLGGRADCGPTRWIKARGTRRWHHHIATVLPRGRYRLHRRAVDASGNRERAHRRHLWIR